MIQLKTYAADTGTQPYWRSYAKALGRRWGHVQAATNFASIHGHAVIHHADDSATIFWREEGMGRLRIKRKHHREVRWLA